MNKKKLDSNWLIWSIIATCAILLSENPEPEIIFLIGAYFVSVITLFTHKKDWIIITKIVVGLSTFVFCISSLDRLSNMNTISYLFYGIIYFLGTIYPIINIRKSLTMGRT